MRSIRSNFVNARLGSIAAAVLVVTAVTAGAAIYALRAHRTAVNTNVQAASAIPAPQDYKTLPAYFEQNLGQTDPRVRYLSHGPNYTVFLTGQGTVLALRKITAAPQPAQSGQNHAKQRGDDVKVTTASVWMNLAGARADAEGGRNRSPARAGQLLYRQRFRQMAHRYSDLCAGQIPLGLSRHRSGLLRHAAGARIRSDCGTGGRYRCDPD